MGTISVSTTSLNVGGTLTYSWNGDNLSVHDRWRYSVFLYADGINSSGGNTESRYSIFTQGEDIFNPGNRTGSQTFNLTSAVYTNILNALKQEDSSTVTFRLLFGYVGYWDDVYSGGASGSDVPSNSPITIAVVTTTACTAPTACSLNATTSTGSNVTLNWSGASGGTNNSITSYFIQRRQHDGSSWGNWTDLQTVNSTSTSGSLSVAVPGTLNYSYQFRVRTQGSAGSSYYSGYKESTNNVKRLATNCGAPTSCSVSATTSSGGNVTLSWSGATSGTLNAINGYLVQKSEWNGSAWGSWTDVQTVSSTATSASLSVAPPSTLNNKFKFRVRTQGAAGSSYYSGFKESTNDLTRIATNCGAPTACSVSATTSTGGNVTLNWSGASSGTLNAINGYLVQKREYNGTSWGGWSDVQTVSSTATSASLSVAPPSTLNNQYQFRVRTQGAAGSSYYSGFKESTNTLTRLGTACGAPSSVSLNATTSTGDTVVLSWTGATSGTLNAINSYLVQRREYDGSSWGNWADVQTVSTTATFGVLNVSPPTAVNHDYQYRVRTQGAAGLDYYSGFTTSSNNLKKICTLSKPSIAMVSNANQTCVYIISTPSTITGATGTVQYNVYRNGTLVDTTELTGQNVTIPSEIVRTWGSTEGIFTVQGTITINGYTATSQMSDGSSFVYLPNTVLYYRNNAFELVQVKIYQNGSFATVALSRYNGISWEDIGTP